MCTNDESYFFSKNDGLQNQYVIYEQDDLKSEPKVIPPSLNWSFI